MSANRYTTLEDPTFAVRGGLVAEVELRGPGFGGATRSRDLNPRATRRSRLPLLPRRIVGRGIRASGGPASDAAGD